MGRKFRVLSPEKPFKILTCGNTIVSGEHGVFIKEGQDKKDIVRQFAKAVIEYANTTIKEGVDAYMLKDFEKESLFITDELLEEGYNSFNVEPNMVLHLNKNWETFDDYLAALKTKFRVKAKKALQQSEALQIKDVNSVIIDEVLPKMTSLYEKVIEKASFNLGDFNLKTYKTLLQQLPNQYFVKVYFLENELVGFLSGMLNNTVLSFLTG